MRREQDQDDGMRRKQDQDDGLRREQDQDDGMRKKQDQGDGMRREQDQDDGMRREDQGSGIRREQDDGRHREKDRKDSENPAIKIIKIDVELEWVWLDGLRDKDTLLGGFELVDKHIYMAQKLLKLQFPPLNGWDSTLIYEGLFLLDGLHSVCKY